MDSKQPVVYIVDDDPAVRDAFALMLEQAGVHARFFSGAEDFLAAYQPDFAGCLVLDVRMPGMDGIQLQRALVERRCTLPIIFLTGHGDIPMSVRAIKAGAVDFLSKPVTYSKLIASIRAAFIEQEKRYKASEPNHEARARLEKLTKREREVAVLAAQGLSSKEIATQLNISYRTVEIHRCNIMRKIGARSLLELARVVRESGWQHI
ncbi:response regulator transcription factor [Nitrosomonas sp. ANs5]|uniref:response regulator transcription factor n=1 Tax=Nitrosomonas sp. ANs5 TaxID=3423941 RepID=UPI003D324D2B